MKTSSKNMVETNSLSISKFRGRKFPCLGIENIIPRCMQLTQVTDSNQTYRGKEKWKKLAMTPFRTELLPALMNDEDLYRKSGAFYSVHQLLALRSIECSNSYRKPASLVDCPEEETVTRVLKVPQSFEPIFPPKISGGESKRHVFSSIERTRNSLKGHSTKELRKLVLPPKPASEDFIHLPRVHSR